jgi:hypothetical protein
MFADGGGGGGGAISDEETKSEVSFKPPLKEGVW